MLTTIAKELRPEMVKAQGWTIGNLDTVVVAARPKLKPYIDPMKGCLAERLAVAPDQVGIKATTNEKLGPVGREEGICAYAVVLLIKN